MIPQSLHPLSQCSNNLRYRARVVNTKLKDQVEVLFIDYGNSAIVSTSKIGALPSAVSNTL